MKDAANNMWTCPKCGRRFERKGQAHSCRVFPLEQHFAGKPRGAALYEKFRSETEERVGSFLVDSPECCIHFVHSSTFVAVEIFKEKIRVEFALNHPIKSGRVTKSAQMPANRYLCFFDLKSEDEIDDELMAWVQEAYDLKK